MQTKKTTTWFCTKDSGEFSLTERKEDCKLSYNHRIDCTYWKVSNLVSASGPSPKSSISPTSLRGAATSNCHVFALPTAGDMSRCQILKKTHFKGPFLPAPEYLLS